MAKAKYAIPEVPDPPENCCICVPIPNDDTHIRNFLGAIQTLTVFYNWDKDDDHNAVVCADVWKDVFTCILEQLGDV